MLKTRLVTLQIMFNIYESESNSIINNDIITL